MFRIVNFTNPDTDLNALPRLRDIYRLIDMKNILRLKSTDDVIEVAKSVCDVVFKLVGENKGTGQQKQNGEGEEDTEGWIEPVEIAELIKWTMTLRYNIPIIGIDQPKKPW